MKLEVSFLFQKGYQTLTAFYNRDRHALPKYVRKRQRALGNMTEHRSILLLLIMQSPVIDLVSVLKLGVKGTAVQQDTLSVNYFKWPWLTFPSTERAKLISHWTPGEHKIVELLGMRGKSPHRIQNILLSTCESLISSKLFLQGERCSI